MVLKQCHLAIDLKSLGVSKRCAPDLGYNLYVLHTEIGPDDVRVGGIQ